jgi:tRNA-dihydrouridine synthase B
MDQTFWQTLAKPIIGLSPMDGVTDAACRQIQKKYGQPALLFTEFSSVEGICRGARELLREFLYLPEQRPIIGQIYGTTPDFFRQTSIMLCELGFDGVDINMGCPAKNVAHSGAGAALIKTPELAKKIIRATQAGVAEWQNGATVADCPDLTPEIQAEIKRRQQSLNLLNADGLVPRRTIPVSVKTRIGFDQIIIKEWIEHLLETAPAAITVHGRTLRQLYSGFADWSAIATAAETVKASGLPTLLLGNGDVVSLADAAAKIAQCGLDGILIGRASFGNPFVFKNAEAEPLDPKVMCPIALEHAKLYEAIYQSEEKYNFLPMRKHLGWYVRGFPQAKEVRGLLVRTNSSQEVEAIFRQFELI